MSKKAITVPLAACRPLAKDFAIRKYPISYGEFVRLLNEELDEGIALLERGGRLFATRKHGYEETPLAWQLVMFLGGKGWAVEHEAYRNGRSDIVIKTEKVNCEWIGEAKLDRGNAALKKALLQLRTYGTGASAFHRALIAFHYRGSVLDRIRNWSTYCESLVGQKIVCECGSCNHTDGRPCRRFRTRHRHSVGDSIEIRHIFVALPPPPDLKK